MAFVDPDGPVIPPASASSSGTFRDPDAAASSSQPLPDEEKPYPGQDIIEGVTDIASGKALAEIAGHQLTGAIAGPVSGLAGIAGTLLPGKEGQGADWTQHVQDSLTYEPRSKVARKILGIQEKPMEWLDQGTNWAGEKSAEATGSPMVGAAVKTALNAIPMALTKDALPAGVKGAMKNVAKTARDRADLANNLERDRNETRRQAADMGYKVPASQANVTLGKSRTLLSGGSKRGARDATEANQEISNAAVRQDLGIPADKPLSSEAYDEASKVPRMEMDKLKNYPKHFYSDETYAASIKEIGKEGEMREASAQHAKVGKDITAIFQDLNVAAMTPEMAVDQMRSLRARASENFKRGGSDDILLAEQQAKAAAALEQMVDRNLVKNGDQNILDKFRAARIKLAQIDVARRYTDTATGNINARGLYNYIDKDNLLTGNLGRAARFAGMHPSSMQLSKEVHDIEPFNQKDLRFAGMARHGFVPGILGAMRAMIPSTAKPQPKVYKPSALSQTSPALAMPLIVGDTEENAQ